MKAKYLNLLTSMAAFGALSPTSPVANAVTLEALLQPDATLVVGDKVFFNFHNLTQQGDLDIPLSAIFVDPVTGGPGGQGNEVGIRFSSSLWALTEPGLEYDFGLNFGVRTLSGSPLITDNTLAFEGDFAGDGRAMIAEGVLDSDGGSLANKFAFMDALGQRMLDHQVFPDGPYAEIQVSKDFAMSTGSGIGTEVSLSHFDQTFSQVPEGGPGLLATLLALGALCWVGRKPFRIGQSPA